MASILFYFIDHTPILWYYDGVLIEEYSVNHIQQHREVP